MFGLGGNKIKENDVLNALRNVEDPDLHKDLVTLGMIKDIKIDGKNISFTVELTTPACPLKEKIESIEAQRITLEQQIPDSWQQARGQFEKLASEQKKARQNYRRNADESYESIKILLKMLNEHKALSSLRPKLPALLGAIQNDTPDAAIDKIKATAQEFDQLTNANPVQSKLSKSRRALKGSSPNKEKAIAQLEIAMQALDSEIEWRSRAANEFLPDLETYDEAIRLTIGMRLQPRLTGDQAESIASCLAV